jgi:4a-hydroxytetrahydrobiopterin dehydratase
VADTLLSADEVDEAVRSRPGWTVADGRLHRRFEFTDFNEAFGFMTRVALAAERLDHHPDWSNGWNKVEIDISNHSAGGITDRCLALADAADAAAG